MPKLNRFAYKYAGAPPDTPRDGHGRCTRRNFVKFQNQSDGGRRDYIKALFHASTSWMTPEFFKAQRKATRVNEFAGLDIGLLGSSGTGSTIVVPLLPPQVDSAKTESTSEGGSTTGTDSGGGDGGSSSGDSDGDGDGEPPPHASLGDAPIWFEFRCYLFLLLIFIWLFLPTKYATVFSAVTIGLYAAYRIFVWFAYLCRRYLGPLWDKIPDFVKFMVLLRTVFPVSIREKYYDPGYEEILREIAYFQERDPPPFDRYWRGFWWRFRFACLLIKCFWKWLVRPTIKAFKETVK